MNSLSLQQARHLVLHSQGLPATASADPLQGTLQSIERLGYIQIDTIAVVERAHHHTLWNRNPAYQASQLDELLHSKQVFEYWSHAAAYLPMRDYRFSLPRKHDLATGQQKHWYECDTQLMRELLARIRDKGPVMSKDFEHTGERNNEWYRKPTKRALEQLFMQGDLMVPYRKQFQKVYELTERVLPSHIDTRLPTAPEYAEFLIMRYLQANGLAQASDFAYLLKNIKPQIKTTLQQLLEDGKVQAVTVNQQPWYVLPETLQHLNQPLPEQVCILSPFDNLLIQRERTRKLFAFDYQIECYTPAAKRKYGYFSLPILWQGELVARMDCKAERRRNTLVIHKLALEPTLRDINAFSESLDKALQSFMAFNGCEQYEGLAAIA